MDCTYCNTSFYMWPSYYRIYWTSRNNIVTNEKRTLDAVKPQLLSVAIFTSSSSMNDWTWHKKTHLTKVNHGKAAECSKAWNCWCEKLLVLRRIRTATWNFSEAWVNMLKRMLLVSMQILDSLRSWSHGWLYLCLWTSLCLSFAKQSW